jgi:hypothetical protein
MNCRRRGIMLVQVLAVLPLIATLTTVSYQVTQRAVRYEAALRRQLASDARMESLARQLRTDAARAWSARMDSSGSEELVLSGCPDPRAVSPSDDDKCVITYGISDTQVTRTERVPGREPIVTAWAGLPGKTQLRVEEIGGRPGVLWAIWKSAAPTDMGPGLQRTISVAATIGGGA